MNTFIKSSGVLSNPSLDAVLIDTGHLPGGIWQLQFMISPSVDQQIAIQKYAPDGVTLLFDGRLFLNNMEPLHFDLMWPLKMNERIKVVEKTSSPGGNISVAIVASGG